MSRIAPQDVIVAADSITKTIHRDVYPTIDASNPANSLAGKVVIVTGASKGLGKYCYATEFAKAGPKAIVITARKVESLKETEKIIHKINPDIKVLSVALELANEESTAKAFDEIKSNIGTADVLVNNAGVWQVDRSPIKDLQTKAWWDEITINVLGQTLVTKYFLQLLEDKKHGVIIDVTSGGAFFPIPGGSSYVFSKLLTIHLAWQTATENQNVTTISLHPGLVKTDMTKDAFLPVSRDSPALVGGFAVWLSTEKATFLNGKYVMAGWDADELMAMKDEIVEKDLLTIHRTGDRFMAAEVVG